MSKAEKFISDCIRTCSNELIGGGWNNGEFVQIFNPWLTPDQARRAVEIAREEIYEWLKEYAYIYSDDLYLEGLIRDLKQAIKNA